MYAVYIAIALIIVVGEILAVQMKLDEDIRKKKEQRIIERHESFTAEIANELQTKLKGGE